MLTALILIISIFAIGMAVPQFLARSFLGPVFRLFAIPGVILHEGGHAIACVLTGTKIHSIRLFKRDGGDVTHDVPKIPIIGPLLITMAPLVIGMVAIIFLASRIMDVSKIQLTTDVRDFWPFLFSLLSAIKWTSIITWVWLYLILSIGATMIPSIQDLKNSWISIAVIIIAIVAIYRFPQMLGPATIAAVAITPGLVFVLFVMLVLLLFSLIIYLLSGIFGTMR